jgi:DNA-binding NarL/FixJ family response regulator
VVTVAKVRFFREGLTRLFAEREGYSVVATAGASGQGLALIREHQPDIALLVLDANAGPPLVRDILASAPTTRVISVGVAEDDPSVVELAEAGVAGYVTTDAGSEDLVRIVDSVACGEALCHPRITSALLQRLASLSRSKETTHRPIAGLTAREREIVELIDKGLSNKEIASHLCIEVATVKNHVHNLLEKLRVTRRGEAAALVRHSTTYAKHQGIDPLGGEDLGLVAGVG